MGDLQSDQRFAQAVSLFNEREFFACHDVLEEIWSETLDERRNFLQGLLHAAVALFHFGEGNLSGARKMHDSALRYLADYGEHYCGIDLIRFRRDFDTSFAALLGSQRGYPEGVVLDENLIPELRMVE